MVERRGRDTIVTVVENRTRTIRQARNDQGENKQQVVGGMGRERSGIERTGW